VLLPPINFIFKLLQQRAILSIWLYENLQIRIEGKLRVCVSLLCIVIFADGLQGFDEFMNLVIDDAVEVSLAQKDKPESRRTLGPYIRPVLASAY
jgi:small nuclear ribonucleoprotein E